jgi:hypothetical protein
MALGTLLPAGTASAEPQKVWEATGLKNPESALYDPAAGTIYVSNTNSDVMEKDGNGFISKLAPDGKVLALEWVKGLDSPTGLALADGVLYAADVDRLVAIDPGKGAITARHDAPGAKFLNDLTADKQGRVFASDMLTNTIWVLEDGKFSPWLQDDALDNPNGLVAEADRLVVGSWGKMEADGSTKVPGHLKVVDLKTKTVADLGDPTPVGNIDGVEPDGKGGYFVADWVKGGLFHATAEGKATRLLPLAPGSADLGSVPGQGLVLVPMSADGTLLAYRVD